MQQFQPYIPPEKDIAEFNVKSVLAGIIFGIIFGCANAYLGLRVGLTISTSIPIAVITVAFFRFSKAITGGSTILENNMSQTVGSASSSMASGLIFTIPALFMWGLSPSLWQITMLAALGSLFGILAMIPLRTFLIVKEHENLPYPEGTACAEVLKAADTGGSQASHVFTGLGVGALYKAAVSFLKLWPDQLKATLPFIPKADVMLEASPALLGVGYIIGLRLAFILALGGFISSVVLIPLLSAFGDGALSFLRPDPSLVLSQLSADDIWKKCIRYVGAGAVTFGGLVSVVRALPTMHSALMSGVHALFGKQNHLHLDQTRTNQDLPMKVVVIGLAAILVILALTPNLLGSHEYPSTWWMQLLATACVALFALLFVTVSSRVVGLVGVSSNPTSAMTIVSLLGTATLFYFIGLTDTAAKALALTIGTVVCTAASKAGDISQDLKAGFLLGATPKRQQLGQLIGASAAAFFVASAIFMLGKTYSFGSSEIPAPQATLMKTIIDGVLSANLPWGLILLGVGIGAFGQWVLRFPALPFAIGIYIPLATNAALLVGGLVRYFIERNIYQRKKLPDHEPGGLLSAGYIAGEGIMGVLIAIYAFVMSAKPKGIGLKLGAPWAELTTLLSLAAVIYLVIRMVQKKK